MKAVTPTQYVNTIQLNQYVPIKLKHFSLYQNEMKF